MKAWQWMVALLLLTLPAMAQAAAPNMRFTVRDSAGQPLAGKSVQVLVELTTGNLDGATQYAETHTTQTDAQGVAGIAIGSGTATDPKYVFDNFDVSQGDNFVRVSLQEAGGSRLLLDTQLPNVAGVRKWLFADEKSNTVIAIMIVVWLGIVVYLLLSGRKLTRLQKQLAALQQGRPSNS